MTPIDPPVPTPPPALVRRIRAALDAAASRQASPSVAEASLDAAMLLVHDVFRDGSGARTGAITLLAADALVTQAFEVAGEHPERIEPLAMDAMTRIAAAAERAR